MITNRYWLVQSGVSTGPFAKGLILEMWNRGQVEADAQVCREGVEDWEPVRFLIRELEEEVGRRIPLSAPPAAKPAVRSFQLQSSGKGGSVAACFVAAVLLGVLLIGCLRIGGDTIFVATLLGVVMVILSIVMLVRGGLLAGLTTLLFVALVVMGQLSSQRYERQKADSRVFDWEMKRLLQ